MLLSVPGYMIKNALLSGFIFLSSLYTNAQIVVTIPWSSSLNVHFGNGPENVGPPLSVGFSDFTYTTSPEAGNGFYSVIKTGTDAGHIFQGSYPLDSDPVGYKMITAYNSLFPSKILFGDTVRGLCSNTKFLFWAGIKNLTPGSCLAPNLTFSVETLSGQIIDTFQTGNIGGAPDGYAWYYGYYNAVLYPPVPFYGGIFQLPAGVSDIVVKIITNPTSASVQCTALMTIDNILLTPVGPDIRINSPRHPGGWIAASCFEGNVPLVLNGQIEPGYLDFGTPDYVQDAYTDPAFQWQQSLDEGYTWTDIPGETNINMAHNFSIPDTFWVRLRVSESGDIGNTHCSNVSNIFKVQVDGLPTDFSLSSNSPVCTDGDMKLELSGGASYNTYGPNGFYDSSPFPHIYRPALKDSGWYYSEIISFGGCKGKDSTYVKIIGPDLKVSPGKSICYNDTLHLSAEGGLQYKWTPVAGLSDPNIPNPVARPLQTILYEVKVTDNSGCTAYGNVKITLRNALLNAAVAGPDVACPSDIIEFRDSSQGEIVSWKWDFSNGAISNQNNPGIQNYPVTNGKSFPVKLTVTDTAGCVQSVVKQFKTVNNCYIAVPSAFTPNGDGLNDFLYPVNAYKATDLTFKVFNRSGNLVFTTNDWNRKWDGTFAGEPQDAGTYVWLLSYTDATNIKVFYKGTVVLLR